MEHGKEELTVSLHDEETPIVDKDRTNKEKKSSYGFLHLIKGATCCDKILLFSGVTMACLLSLTTPFTGLIYGQATSAFILNQNVSMKQQMTKVLGGLSSGTFQQNIDLVVMMFLGLTAFHVITSFATAMLVCVPSVRIVNTLRKNFLRHITRSDRGFLETQRTGELNTMFFEHTERVLEAFSVYGIGILNTILSALLALAVAFFINWKQTACVAVLMPTVAIVGIWAIKKLVKMYMAEQQVMTKSTQLVYETLRSIRTVLSFNGQKQTMIKYMQLAKETRSVAQKRSLFEGLAFGIEIFLNDAIGCVSFIFGAFFVTAYSEPSARGNMYTVAIELLMVTALAYSLQVPITSFLGAKANLAEMGNVMLTKPNIDSLSTEGEELEVAKGDGVVVEFKDIQFSYPARPEMKVLNGISVKVNRGDHLAVVGASGAGKSTLAALIMRFYDPDSGTITVNGIPLMDLNVKSWRRVIGYVSQEAPVFDGTVMENIRYGKLDATDEEVYQAAKAANVDRFVETMPDKFATWIGERGVQLSGGQRQRLAIARALIRQPELLVFDEFTASLDSVTEEAVCEELNKIVKGKTTVTIAHRLSTIRGADRIIVLADGKIVESGSHDQLMAITEGHYVKMVKMQELQGREDEEDMLDVFGDQAAISSYGESTDVERAALALSTDTDGMTLMESRKKLPRHPLSSKDASLHGSRASLVPKTAVDDGQSSSSSKDKEKRRRGSVFKLLPLIDCKTWMMLVGSFVGSFVFALSDTLSLLIFALLLIVLPAPLPEMQEGVVLISVLSVVFAVVTCGARVFFTYWHNRFGDAVVYNLRMKLMNTILKHNMSYFDKPMNSTGELWTVIVKNAGKLRKAIVQDMLLMPCSLLDFVLRMGIALYVNAGFAFFCMLVLPADFVLYMVANAANWAVQKRIDPAMNESGKVAGETIDNLDTIQAYSLETKFCERYEKHLKKIEMSVQSFFITPTSNRCSRIGRVHRGRI